MQNIIYQVIQIPHFMLELIFWNYCPYMLRLVKATYLSLLFKFAFSVWLSNSLWGSDVLLFLEFINIVFILILYINWIYCIVIHFFSNFFCSVQRIYDLFVFIYYIFRCVCFYLYTLIFEVFAKELIFWVLQFVLLLLEIFYFWRY